MRTISSTTGSDSESKASWEDRDLTNAFTGQTEYQEIIKKAQSFPLEKVLKFYGTNIDPYSRKCVCPFPSHKGGRESTPSFYFYPETNTFWCFGCKAGTTCVDFISKIEKISKIQAAFKILNNFNSELNLNLTVQDYEDSYQEKSKLLFSFSQKMRDVVSQDRSLLEEVEKIYFTFDKMNDKYELDNKALSSLISKLEIKLEEIVTQKLFKGEIK